MDVFTHATVGAITGAAFNAPVTGAVVATLPDLTLCSIRRLKSPTEAYKLAHSFIPPAMLAAILPAVLDWRITACIVLAWLSHIVIDIPTHGAKWSPRLFYPDQAAACTALDEWEWFNNSWWRGMTVAQLWCVPFLYYIWFVK